MIPVLVMVNTQIHYPKMDDGRACRRITATRRMTGQTRRKSLGGGTGASEPSMLCLNVTCTQLSTKRFTAIILSFILLNRLSYSGDVFFGLSSEGPFFMNCSLS